MRTRSASRRPARTPCHCTSGRATGCANCGRSLSEAVLAAEVLDRHPAFDPLQEPGDLLVRMSASAPENGLYNPRLALKSGAGQ